MRNGKYEMIVAPDDWPGKRYRGRYCYEHHYVFWKQSGTLIEANVTCIHHKNGDTRDNRIENLELLGHSEHASKHAVHGETFVEMKCSFCEVRFKREIRNVNTRIKKGQKDFYCSRSCMAKHFGRGRLKKNNGVA